MSPKTLRIVLIAGGLALLAICALFGVAIWLTAPYIRSFVQQAQRPPASLLVGQAGGGVWSCALRDDYAYAGVGQRLLVLDVRDPVRTEVVGQTPLLDIPAEEIALNGSYAYILSHGEGIRIVDLTDPQSPLPVGTFQGRLEDPWALVANGGYLYIAGDDGLEIADLADPASPRTVGTFQAEGTSSFQDLAVTGDFVYLVDLFSTLRIVNVADKAHPAQIGALAIDAYHVAVDGNHVYVLMRETLEIFRVTGPGQSEKVSSFTLPAFARDITVQGDYVYLTADGDPPIAGGNPGTGGLRVLDISDPTQPREVGFLSTGGTGRQVAIAGATACVVSGFAARIGPPNTALYLVDLADPTNLRELWSFAPDFVAARKVVRSGDYAYVADTAGYLRTFAISATESPQEIGACHVAKEVNDLVVSGTLVYAAADDGVHVIQAADPARPAVVGNYPLAEARGLALEGPRIYVSGSDQLYVLDVKQPSTPQLLGRYDLRSGGGKLAVSGNIIYQATLSKGLYVLDATQSDAIAELGHLDILAWHFSMAANTLYVADDDDTLHVLDVTDPAHPVDEQTIDIDGPVYDLVVADDVAYIANGAVLAFSLPGSAYTRPGTYDIPGPMCLATSIALSRNRVYVATIGCGLFVLDRAALLER